MLTKKMLLHIKYHLMTKVMWIFFKKGSVTKISSKDN